MLFYKLRGFEKPDRIHDILTNERLYCAPWYQLNDPFEGRIRQRMSFPGWKRRVISDGTLDDFYPSEEGVFRVCSLSASVNDVRLWSHYADGHSGLAVEIDY